MSTSLNLRRVTTFFVALALINAPIALFVAYQSPLYRPDDAHTFAITYRGSVTRFYTQAVGVYLVCSGVFSCFAGGLFGLDRLLKKT